MRRARALPIALCCATAAVAIGILVLRSDASEHPAVTSNVAQIERQLGARLHDRLLSPRWIACVRNGRSYRGAAVVRCNVNFGDPHIEAYCSVLSGGRLLTQHDAPIPCGHDDAGWVAPVQVFS